MCVCVSYVICGSSCYVEKVRCLFMRTMMYDIVLLYKQLAFILDNWRIYIIFIVKEKKCVSKNHVFEIYYVVRLIYVLFDNNATEHYRKIFFYNAAICLRTTLVM